MTDDDVTRLDAPNQQVVRPDGSGPADEGSGGSTSEAKPKRGPGRPPGSRSAPKPESTDDDGNDG